MTLNCPCPVHQATYQADPHTFTVSHKSFNWLLKRLETPTKPNQKLIDLLNEREK